jgi:hypothetical protein
MSGAPIDGVSVGHVDDLSVADVDDLITSVSPQAEGVGLPPLRHGR